MHQAITMQAAPTEESPPPQSLLSEIKNICLMVLSREEQTMLDQLEADKIAILWQHKDCVCEVVWQTSFKALTQLNCDNMQLFFQHIARSSYEQYADALKHFLGQQALSTKTPMAYESSDPSGMPPQSWPQPEPLPYLAPPPLPPTYWGPPFLPWIHRPVGNPFFLTGFQMVEWHSMYMPRPPYPMLEPSVPGYYPSQMHGSFGVQAPIFCLPAPYYPLPSMPAVPTWYQPRL